MASLENRRNRNGILTPTGRWWGEVDLRARGGPRRKRAFLTKRDAERYERATTTARSRLSFSRMGTRSRVRVARSVRSLSAARSVAVGSCRRLNGRHVTPCA
jgi:hypothetical protein